MKKRFQSWTLDEKFFPAQETSENSREIIEGSRPIVSYREFPFRALCLFNAPPRRPKLFPKKMTDIAQERFNFLPPTIVCSLNCLRLLPEGFMRYVLFPWRWKLSQMAVFCMAMTQDYMDEQIFVIPENFGKLFFFGLDKGRHDWQTFGSTRNYAVFVIGSLL